MELLSPPCRKINTLPTVPRDALAGVRAGDVGELSLEGGGEGKTVQPFLSFGSGGQRGVVCPRCNVWKVWAMLLFWFRREVGTEAERAERTESPINAAGSGQDRYCFDT